MDHWKISIDRMDRAFSPHDFAAIRFLGRWPRLGWHRALGAPGGGAFAAVLARAEIEPKLGCAVQYASLAAHKQRL
jgi:hypothetical protein